jgi:predicted nuclease of predicted toxin-antitoxin system
VRFLVDECLPTWTADRFRDAGHDAVHVGDLDLLGAADELVMEAAARDGRILVSADTDFGELLAIGKHVAPSVILLRGLSGGLERRILLVVDNLDQVEDELHAGAIVVFTGDRIRVRLLPVDQ